MINLLILESRRLWRDRTARWLCLLLLLACALAVLQGHATMKRLQEANDLALASAENTAAGLRSQLAADAPPELAVILPFRVQMPVPEPQARLGDFNSGLLDASPGSASVGLRSRTDNLRSSTATDNPELSLRGSFDLSFVASVMAPLVLMALCYNLYADDRDRGTARLLLAQGGTPVRTLIIRSIPRLLLVTAPLCLSTLVLLLLTPWLPGRGTAAGSWLLLALAQLCFWWALIVLINSFRLSSDAAALSLVSMWVLLTLLVPVILATSARLAHPPPSRFEQLATARAAEVSAMAEWDNDHPELATEGFEGRLASLRKSLTVEREVSAAVSPVNERFQQQLESQQAFLRQLAWLSPVLVTQNAMARVAGTDRAQASEFRAAVKDYLAGLKARLGTFIERGELMTAEDFNALPLFDWEPERRSAVPTLAYLIGLAGLLGWIGTRRLSEQPL